MFKRERMGQLGNELDLIQNRNIKVFTIHSLRQAPEYWWTQESSKVYHYKDERKKGGRVKHARRCAKLAHLLAEALDVGAAESGIGILDIVPVESDLLVSASLLHDICVRGVNDEPSSDRALPYHPLLVRTKLAILIESYTAFYWMDPLLGLIETHMGKWGSIPPRTGLEKLFHMVDCIASRDFVKIEV